VTGIDGGKLLRNIVRRAARDRRTAAIHEAGHLTVAYSLGLNAHGSIHPVFDNEPGENLWIGVSHLLARPNKRQNRMIGVAGAVAEALQKAFPEEFLEDEHYFWSSPDAMSETDWRLTGCPPGNPDKLFLAAVEKVASLLQRNDIWRELMGTARDLIAASRLRLRPPRPLSARERFQEWQRMRTSAEASARWRSRQISN
jgi:hypothetical protein